MVGIKTITVSFFVLAGVAKAAINLSHQEVAPLQLPSAETSEKLAETKRGVEQSVDNLRETLLRRCVNKDNGMTSSGCEIAATDAIDEVKNCLNTYSDGLRISCIKVAVSSYNLRVDF
jgi:hypothetical protein